MRQLFVIIAILVSQFVSGQNTVSYLTPPPSPEAKVTQQLISGELTVSYSRPLARARIIFGGIVP